MSILPYTQDIYDVYYICLQPSWSEFYTVFAYFNIKYSTITGFLPIALETLVTVFPTWLVRFPVRDPRR